MIVLLKMTDKWIKIENNGHIVIIFTHSISCPKSLKSQRAEVGVNE